MVGCGCRKEKVNFVLVAQEANRKCGFPSCSKGLGADDWYVKTFPEAKLYLLVQEGQKAKDE